MKQARRIINPSRLGPVGYRLIGTTDVDGNGTAHEVAAVDPLVLFDFVRIDPSRPMSHRPHPHHGLTAMSFLPRSGTWRAWDNLAGDTEDALQAGGLYYVHAGRPAFHHEYPAPESVAAGEVIEFLQLVWNATDEDDVRTVIIQPGDVPVVDVGDARIRVLAGDIGGASGAQPFSRRKILYGYIELDGGGSTTLEVPAGMNGILFAIDGAIRVDGDVVQQHQMMILGADDTALRIDNATADRQARFILAAGEPVGRPFVKLLGVGGFIIGENETDVRRKMNEMTEQSEALKRVVPHYFSPEYR